jgi:hypothetical protein
MEDENWKAVVGFEGLYEVSDRGRVRSLDREVPSRFGQRTIPGRVMKLAKDSAGYLSLLLYQRSEGKSKRPCKRELVSRLVVISFLGLPNNPNDQANHIDFDRSNNLLTNLEWKTPSGNVQHSVLAGRWAGPHDSAKNPKKWKKLDLEAVRSAILDAESGMVTKYRAAKNLGISCAMMTRYCQQRDRYFPITPPA